MKRRNFFGRLAAVAAVPATVAKAHQDPKAGDTPDPLQAEIDARLALLVARYGDRLDDEAHRTIRDDLRQHLRRSRRLKSFALENGDGPSCLLVPYRDPV